MSEQNRKKRTAIDLESYLTLHKIDAQLIRLSSPTLTVATAAEAAGVTPDQIVKSVLFIADTVPVLVIANGMNRISYKKLSVYFKVSRKKLRMATAPQVEAITGYEVGSVPPFGHTQAIRTIVDRGIKALPEVYAGGGSTNALVRMTTEELLRVTMADQVSVVREENS